MSWKSNEYIPEERILAAIVRDAVVPTLTKMGNDLGIVIQCEPLELYVGEAAIRTIKVDIEDSCASTVNGATGRIRCRKTSVIGRSLFFCQVRLDRRVPHSNLDGVVVDGTVRMKDGIVTVATESITAVHGTERWLSP